MDALLSARGYRRDTNTSKDGYVDWDHAQNKNGIRVAEVIFTKNGDLKVITPEDWDAGWVETYTLNPEPSDDDDEIPF